MAAGGRRVFAVRLLLILVAAFGLRAIYTVVGTIRPEPDVYDWTWYRGEARSLAYGHGFVQPDFLGMPAKGAGPTAAHPPLYPILLAPVSRLIGDTSLLHDDVGLRLFNCVLGTLAVGLIGLLARELAGDGAGLIAAGIAAVYPNLWVNDGLIMSETLGVVIVTGAVIATVALVRRRSMKAALALAVLCGLGALARGELLLMFPLLCLPAVLVASRGDRKLRLRLLGVSVIAGVVVVGPWIGFNLTRFERPVFFSTNFDLTLEGANCPAAVAGRFMGGVAYCTVGTFKPSADESVNADAERAEAKKLIRRYLKREPLVMVARFGRTWSLYRVADSVRYGVADGRPEWVSELGLVCFYPLMILAIAAVWLRRRRRELFWPLLVPAAIITITTLLAFGSVRYRASTEPMIVVLAALALASPELRQRLRLRRAGPTESTESPEPLEPPEPTEAPAPVA